MSTTNIIQRRDLEPLWLKATEVARHYEKAGNCISALIGADYVSMEPSKHPKSTVFCSLCKRYYSGELEHPLSDTPCSAMHRDAVRESIRLGGSYVYTCAVGFFFWTSPFFSMERFAGAFISGGALALEKQRAVDKMFETCKGEVSGAELAGHFECIPERGVAEVEALAQMLTLCANHVSRRESHKGEPAIDGRVCRANLPRDYFPTLVDKERTLMANLRRGDSAEALCVARELLSDLNNVLNAVGNGTPGDNLEYLKLKATEMIVLLSRAGATEEKNEALVEASGHYLKRVKDSKNAADVIEGFCLIVERMAGKIFSFQGVRHASALRKAERFIWENYARKVSLKEIADVSGLSAPYFSTIFKDEMRENLSDYLNRLRVEKATTMLRETDLLISEISAACGFEDQSWFSKIFKNHTGISPCKYRRTVGVAPLEQSLTVGR